MQNDFFKIILITALSFFLYRYRYRILNFLLNQPMLRQIMVKSFIGSPFIRERMMGQLFR
ncbi:hypothetical protein [Calidifontibacillus erzurumensis]|uniref:Na+/H+ antiporter n=1 Tax=Calidifontibacillus erzurumensis TaxID=2741433 RepID=A0A8J8GEH5_9BACI|nr:hypothetical protein [Calidifontibacillus erzurumensis]NSL50338.1 hypothetical protein [Calidifontibacillus erzurumensis]